MTALTVLLRHRAILWKNSVLRGKGSGMRLFAVVWLAWLFFSVYRTGAYFGSAVASSDAAAVSGWLSLALVGLFMTAVVIGAAVLLNQLFLAKDLELLLAAPIAPRDLFALKLAEGVLANHFFGLLAIAGVFGYGVGFGAGPLFYLVALTVIIVIVTVATLFDMIAVLLLARFLPAKGLQKALTVAMGLFAIAFVISVRTLVFPGPDDVARHGRQIPEPPVDASKVPLAGSFDLEALQAGRWGAVAIELGLVVVAVVALTLAALYVFERTFYEGRGRLTEAPQRGRRPHRAGVLAHLVAAVPSALRPLVLKDWRVALRDPRLLALLIMPVALIALITITPVFGGDAEGDASGLAVPLIALLSITVLPFFLAGSLATAMFGTEGKALTLLRATPLTMRRLMVSKCVSAALPLTLVMAIAIVGVAVVGGVTVPLVVLALAGTLVLVTVNVAVHTAGAALFYDFDSDNPQQAMGCLGVMVPMALSTLVLVSAGAFIGWGVAFASGEARGIAALVWGVLSTAFAAISLSLVAVLWRRAERRLERWPE